MTRKLHDFTLQVWRAIGAAGPTGIGSTALHDKFTNVIDGTVVSARLQTLLNGGYVARKGANRWGLWVIEKTCKVPEGEVAPVWLHESPDEDSEAHAQGWAKREGKADVKLPAAPASVFNLAQGLNWKPPETAAEPSLREQIAAQEKASVPGFKSPLPPATNKETITFPSPSGGWGKVLFPGDVLTVTTDGDDEPKATNDFLCYVDSNGDTYIFSQGGQIELPPEHTRKLMKYFALINAASMLMEPAGAAA